MTITAPSRITVKPDFANLVDGLKAEHAGLVITYRWLDRATIHLDTIALPKHQQNSGIGTAVMTALTGFAQQRGLRIMLVPLDFFGSDLMRLRNFYRRLGFVRAGNMRFVFVPTP